jgi:hypothetical protein
VASRLIDVLLPAIVARLLASVTFMSGMADAVANATAPAPRSAVVATAV